MKQRKALVSSGLLIQAPLKLSFQQAQEPGYAARLEHHHDPNEDEYDADDIALEAFKKLGHRLDMG